MQLGNASPPKGIVFCLAGLAWCSFTFWFWAEGVRQTTLQWRTSAFVSTTGTMTHAAAVPVPGGRSSSWKAEVSYDYVVEGKNYTSTLLRYDPSNSNHKDIEKLLTNYPLDQPVTVFYNPIAPGEAVLEAGVDWLRVGAAIWMLTPFTAGALGFLGFFLCWPLSRWLRRPVVAVSVRQGGLQTRIRFYDNSPALQAIGAAGLGGVLSIFGAMVVALLLPQPVAMAIALIALISLTFVAWWHARGKYVEIRRDVMLGVVEVSRDDGKYTLLSTSNFESFWPKRRSPDQPLPPQLRYFDETNKRRSLFLPRQATQAEAAEIAAWLNRLLELPS